MVNISVSGTMANINTPGTDCDISISTGTLSMADILINGYEFDVTGENIQIMPLVAGNVSNQYSGGGLVNVLSPAEVYPTMKDVGTLYPTSFWTGNTNDGQFTGCVMTFDHVFIYDNVLGEGQYIHRFALDDFYEQIYAPSGEDAFLWKCFTLYNDRIMYALVESDGKEKLIKFDFCDSSEDVIYAVDDPVVYKERNYIMWEPHVFHCEYNNVHYIVSINTWAETGSWDGEGYILQVLIYNINANSVSNQFLSICYDGWSIRNYTTTLMTSPSIYENKIIFTCGVNKYWNDPPSACYIPTFIVNFVDGTIVKKEDYVTSLAFDIGNMMTATSVIDYTEKKYYFIAYDNSSGAYALFSVDLTSPATVKVRNIDSFWVGCFYQGNPEAYFIYHETGKIMKVSTWQLVATVDPINYYTSSVQIDNANKIAWIFRNTTLQGVSLDLLPDKLITISGGTLFSYNNSRMIYLRILAETMMVFVHSTGPLGVQNQWYLLKKAIPCE